MSRYTETASITVSKEQERRMEKAVKEGEYSSKSDYVRSMMEAGESNIAELDPRTSETDSATHVSHDSAAQAAKALSDITIIDQLGTAESNKKGFDESINELRQEFEDAIVGRLQELAQEPSSPVQNDGKGNYWIESDQ